MVNLTIVVEGGAPMGDPSADTANNTESLRESFYKFFSAVLNRDDIAITVYMASGYKAAAKQYIQGNAHCLYVDSDNPKEKLDRWHDELVNKENPEKTIIIPEEKKSHIFFMIQEMEAWFLKQPACLDRWATEEGYIRKHPDEQIADHSLIRDKDIESIRKPSDKLGTLLGRYFEKELRNKNKKRAQYGKLKTAPQLLDSIDVGMLIPLDTELQRFRSTINQ